MFTIGYYDDSAGHGGTTQYLVELLSALDRRRFRPVVFSPSPSGWHEQVIALGAEVVVGPPRSGTGPSASPLTPVLPIRPTAPPAAGLLTSLRQAVGWHRGLRREIASIAELFRRCPVDLLHSNNVGEEAAPIAARVAAVPRIVGTLHVDPSYDLLGAHDAPRYRALQRRSLTALDLAIAVSDSTASMWRHHLGLTPTDAPKTVVIPNGIRLDRLARRRDMAAAKADLGLPATDLVIGSIGRLDYAKGYIDLIEALPAVVAAVPEVRFVHAGQGPLAETLRREAARLGVAERITWLGFRPDVRDLLEAADVYVQPSWCEAQGLGVLEAAALSVPVVATAVGGLPETLHDGQAGWLAAPRDPAALAQRLIEALQSPELRRRHATALLDRVHRHYTQDHMVTTTMAQYDRLLSEIA